MTVGHHKTQLQTEPRPGTKRRALWDRLHAAPNQWVEFEAREYASSSDAIGKLALAFRALGCDLRCSGSGGTCRWMVVR